MTRGTLVSTSGLGNDISTTLTTLNGILAGIGSSFDPHVVTVLPSIAVGLCCICLGIKRGRNTSHMAVASPAASLRNLSLGASALPVVGCVPGTSTCPTSGI